MIGMRIKEERERLGYTQQGLADVIGVAKRTFIDWEKDRTSPTAVQLSALSKVGVDILYVVTGTKPALETEHPPLKQEVKKPEEQYLLEAFEGMTPEQRKSFLEVGRFYTQPAPDKKCGS